MNLRSPLPARQLLFVLLLAANGLARAQDRIVTLDNQVQQGRILGTAGNAIRFQAAAGTINYPFASVKEVNMAAPPAFEEASRAYSTGDFAGALAKLTPLVREFAGLSTPWMQQATALLGDVYVELNDLPKAEAAYAEYARRYPGAGNSPRGIVGLARLALARKDFAGARRLLEPIVAAALKLRRAPDDQTSSAYGHAFLVLGQVDEAEKKLPAALEDYLRTVTIFYADANAASAAQNRADTLRKNSSVTLP